MYERISQNESIESKLSTEKYQIIRAHFDQKPKMKNKELYEIMVNLMPPGVEYDKAEFNECFRHMDWNNDGKVDFIDFIDHILSELKIKESFLNNQLADDGQHDIISTNQTPIDKNILIADCQGNRFESIQSIHFFSNKTLGDSLGYYVTTHRDFHIVFWSFEMKYIEKVQLSLPGLADFQFKKREKLRPPLESARKKFQKDSPEFGIFFLQDVQLMGFYIECDSTISFMDVVTLKPRYVLKDLPISISCVHYFCDGSQPSKLILGGVYGGLLLFEFHAGWNFSKKKNSVFLEDFIMESFDSVRLHKDVRVDSFNCHPNTCVTQVQYCKPLKSIISISMNSWHSETPVRTVALTKLIMGISGNIISKKQTNYYQTFENMNVFIVTEENKMIVTGGWDGVVRQWNLTNLETAETECQKHDSPIIGVHYHSHYQQIISFSTDGVIKIWDTLSNSCIQTYTEAKNHISCKSTLCFYFCHLSECIILGGSKLVAIPYGDYLNEKRVGGYTSQSLITHAKYSKKIEILIVCYKSSDIHAWDPFKNVIVYVINNAHAQRIGRDFVRYEITSLSMDDEHDTFVTGATNGSIHVWRTQIGMKIKKDTMTSSTSTSHNTPVTFTSQYKNQLLAAGWTEEIHEFNIFTTHRKSWRNRHDFVTTGALHEPDYMLTGHINGDLVFWNLVFCQPFSKYNIHNPTPSLNADITSNENVSKLLDSVTSVYKSNKLIHKSSVNALLFFKTRPIQRDTGLVLLTIQSSGYIQCWNTYGFLHQFKVRTYKLSMVTSLALDDEEKYLFTGLSSGYLKTWLIESYCYPANRKTISLPKLRHTFPFLWKSLFKSRCERVLDSNEMKDVMCVNTYRAHLKSISAICYVNKNEILITASLDKTIRLWHLSGTFIGTLGDTNESTKILNELYIPKPPYKVPQCFRRSLSIGSLKVFTRESTTKQLYPADRQREDPYIGQYPMTYGEKQKIKNNQLQHTINQYESSLEKDDAEVDEDIKTADIVNSIEDLIDQKLAQHEYVPMCKNLIELLQKDNKHDRGHYLDNLDSILKRLEKLDKEII